MIGHLWKLALVVALSHGYRVVGRAVGPRWAGLITALPCSTAIALLGGGSDSGLDYAVTMANACWVGLAGASALPLAFASASVAGWGLVRSALLGILAYFGVVLGLSTLGQATGSNFLVAIAFIALATWLANRVVDPVVTSESRRLNLSTQQVFWLRTMVPMICLGGVLGLGSELGPNAAGCLGAFPGVTLTTLLLTRMESGPVAAVRMARALPPGNWAMVAFLATFTHTVQTLGLGGSVALGYLSALICLGTVAHLTNPSARVQLRSRVHCWHHEPHPEVLEQSLPHSGWPRTPRPFAPLVESVAA